MKPPPATLSRPLDASRIPVTGYREAIAADALELRELAEVLKLPALHSLTAELAVSRWRGQGIKIRGRLEAELEQICVVTLDVFRTRLEDEIVRYFLPRGELTSDDAIMIGEGDADLFDDGMIDLGAVVAESLALALDPYPRRPGVHFEDTKIPVSASSRRGDPPSPFAALEPLKRQKR